MKNIWEIEKMMGLKKVESPHHTGGFFYEGTMSTGDFNGVDDYNRGLLSLKIFQHPLYPTCKVSISTIDDGMWQGYSDEIFTGEQIEALALDIIKEYGIRLPSEEEFNKFLNQYKIHGIYTG